MKIRFAESDAVICDRDGVANRKLIRNVETRKRRGGAKEIYYFRFIKRVQVSRLRNILGCGKWRDKES